MFAITISRQSYVADRVTELVAAGANEAQAHTQAEAEFEALDVNRDGEISPPDAAAKESSFARHLLGVTPLAYTQALRGLRSISDDYRWRDRLAAGRLSHRLNGRVEDWVEGQAVPPARRAEDLERRLSDNDPSASWLLRHYLDKDADWFKPSNVLGPGASVATAYAARARAKSLVHGIRPRELAKLESPLLAELLRRATTTLTLQTDAEALAREVARIVRANPGRGGVVITTLLTREEGRRALALALTKALGPDVNVLPYTAFLALQRESLVGLEVSHQRVDVEFEDIRRLCGAQNVTARIAVVDNGGFSLHPDIEDSLAADGHYDFVEHDPEPFVAAEAPHGTEMLDIATHDTQAIEAVAIRTDMAGIVQAIEHAAATGARVVNLSMEIWPSRQADFDLIAAAIDRHPDVLFVKAAGNGGAEVGVRPYDLNLLQRPNFLVIAGGDAKGGLHEVSNHGSRYVQLAALAEDVPSARGSDGQVLRDGTSRATALVSRLAAKLLVLDPNLDAAGVAHVLSITADRPTSWRAYASAGVINPRRAMLLAAFGALLRRGVSEEQALARLALHGNEHQQTLTTPRR